MPNRHIDAPLRVRCEDQKGLRGLLINDYILLFNYLRKKDNSEYYVKIKELLCSIIEENPEIAELIDNYFFLFSKFRIIDENTSVIEDNYKKITETIH